MKLSKCRGLFVTFAGLIVSAVAGERPTMTIRIVDQADVPTFKMKNMERDVENTFAAIDVNVNWVDCKVTGNVCKSLRGQNEFWLEIVTRLPPNAVPHAEILGFAQRDSGGFRCVRVSYPTVERFSQSFNVDSNHVFGAVVVHEIGHLFGQAHTLSGIMCGRWSFLEIKRASFGQLGFTRQQGESIRAAMVVWPGR